MKRPRPNAEALGALEAELRALYAETDALYKEHACPSSADCCKFRITGREPYVTSIEAEIVVRAIARSGRPVASPVPRRLGKRRSLPLAGSPDLDDAERARRATSEGWCRLLGNDGRCSVYADRPLGCRTFYCDRATVGRKVRQREVNELVRRVKDLALRYAAGADRPAAAKGDLGIPLGRALDALR